MRRSRRLVVAAFLITVSACAESALIRSSPEGAHVFVNDQLIGSTPCVFSVKRSDLQDSYTLRVEKDGFEPYMGSIQTRIAGGRMTGAIFTLGIVYLFRSPWYLAAPGAIPLLPSAEAETDRRLGRELRELNRLLMEKQITPEEFEKRRSKLLEGE